MRYYSETDHHHDEWAYDIVDNVIGLFINRWCLLGFLWKRGKLTYKAGYRPPVAAVIFWNNAYGLQGDRRN